jgi:hypothetical protein
MPSEHAPNESRSNRVCENRDGETLTNRHVAKRDSHDECGEQRTNEACSNRVSRIRESQDLRFGYCEARARPLAPRLLTLRSAAYAARLEGWRRVLYVRPFFETRPSDAPQDEGRSYRSATLDSSKTPAESAHSYYLERVPNESSPNRVTQRQQTSARAKSLRLTQDRVAAEVAGAGTDAQSLKVEGTPTEQRVKNDSAGCPLGFRVSASSCVGVSSAKTREDLCAACSAASPRAF